MRKPELPRRGAEEWGGGFVLPEEHQHGARSIEARGGLVIAGGTNVYMLRPGARGFGVCPPPQQLGPVHAVAVEPRGARRYALAAGETFAVFVGVGKEEEIIQVDLQHPGSRFTHLAWCGATGPCSLWARRDDGQLLRMKADLSGATIPPLGPVDALGSDDGGGIAFVSLVPGAQRVYVTRDGREIAYRAISPEISPSASVEIAVAGMAVALVVDERYVLLSRRPDEPFARVQALELLEDRHFTLGPVAFEGASSDAALFCAQRDREASQVVRVDASGAAMAIFAMHTIDDSAPPEISALSWDATRQALWGVSPDGGMFTSTAPGAKGGRYSLS